MFRAVTRLLAWVCIAGLLFILFTQVLQVGHP